MSNSENSRIQARTSAALLVRAIDAAIRVRNGLKARLANIIATARTFQIFTIVDSFQGAGNLRQLLNTIRFQRHDKLIVFSFLDLLVEIGAHRRIFLIYVLVGTLKARFQLGFTFLQLFPDLFNVHNRPHLAT